MNERIKELLKQATKEVDPYDRVWVFSKVDQAKFAELIIQECCSLLFDESERLFAYSAECDNMRESDEAELIAEKCIDLIAMIEHHFGVEE
jgi:hypothetical protein